MPAASVPEAAHRENGSSEVMDVGEEYDTDPQPLKSAGTGKVLEASTVMATRIISDPTPSQGACATTVCHLARLATLATAPIWAETLT